MQGGCCNLTLGVRASGVWIAAQNELSATLASLNQKLEKGGEVPMK